jgi:hypothetical protein
MSSSFRAIFIVFSETQPTPEKATHEVLTLSARREYVLKHHHRVSSSPLSIDASRLFALDDIIRHTLHEVRSTYRL